MKKPVGVLEHAGLAKEALDEALAGNRVVFNIKGNSYRIVVAMKYEFFSVYIRFIGTHAAYDKIDAETV